MSKIDKKVKSLESTVVHLGAMSVNPLTTIPNLPTVNSTGFTEGKVISWGGDNLLPYYLENLAQISPTQAAIIDYKANQIAGRSVKVIGEAKYLKITDRQYKKMFKSIKGDVSTFEAVPFQLITNTTGQIVTIIPLPTNSVRSGDYENGSVKEYYYKQNWADTGTQYETIRAWNPTKKGGKKGKFIAYLKDQKAGQLFYNIPSYFAAWRWIDLEDTMSEFHKNNIDNGFFPSVILEFFGQEPSKEEKAKFLNNFKTQFTGKGSEKIIAFWSGDPEDKTNITTFQPANLPDYFENLTESVSNKIITSHKISPLLVGIKLKGTTGLGSNAEEIQASFALYQSSTIQPLQDMITDFLEEIHEYNGDEVSIQIIPNVPDFEYEAVKGKRNDLEPNIEEDVKVIDLPKVDGDIADVITEDPEAKDPGTALNGAQVAALLDVVAQVTAGTLDMDTAIKVIATAFPMTEAEARDLLSDIEVVTEPKQIEDEKI